MKQCERCRVLDESVKEQPDPYAQDVDGDDTPHLLCDKCVEELADEI